MLIHSNGILPRRQRSTTSWSCRSCAAVAHSMTRSIQRSPTGDRSSINRRDRLYRVRLRVPPTWVQCGGGRDKDGPYQHRATRVKGLALLFFGRGMLALLIEFRLWVVPTLDKPRGGRGCISSHHATHLKHALSFPPSLLVLFLTNSKQILVSLLKVWRSSAIPLSGDWV